LYLDQMFRMEVANSLRARGHDVVRAAEIGMARADDREIIERASADNRILVTLDEHFGNWAVLPLSVHAGVIRLKVHPPSVANVLPVLHACLSRNAQRDFRNRLLIVDTRRERWITTAD